jgi:hypothetical protein
LYNPKYTSGCGLTCGEATERNWAELGRIGSVVKECTPQLRREILEDCLLDRWMEMTMSIIPNLILKKKRVLKQLDIVNSNYFIYI